MKISIIGPGIMDIPPKGWGAVEILIWDYYESLKSKGHDVQIVNTQNINKIITDVNNFNPDFVHLQYDDLYHVLDKIDCKFKAATSHYGYIENHFPHYGYYQNIINGFINSNFYIFCLSDRIKNVYSRLGVSNERLFITPNGARKELFNYSENPIKKDKSIFLAKITDRKRQFLFQNIKSIDFAGNKDDHRFNYNLSNYLGEWNKQTLYNNLSEYANLILLSDGEADPLVTKEALISGLGLVISEPSTANLDLSKPFIDVIPESKIRDVNYVEEIIKANRLKSISMREEIRQYGINNFDWSTIVDKYIELIKKLIETNE
jgi:glycosyltransferase involved in cell wall biosynthesis